MIEDLTEEQVSLDQTVRRWVAERGEEIRWTDLAEQGWLAQVFSEASGGTSGLKADLLLLGRALGTGLLNLPFISGPVLCGDLIVRLAGDARRETLLSGIMDGSGRFALAHSEQEAGYELQAVATRARPEGAGYIINGQKSLVLDADTADTLLVSARSSGGCRDRHGISLFLVDPRTPGVEISSYSLIDGQRAADVALRNVHVPACRLLGTLNCAIEFIEDAVDAATVALLGDAVGTIDLSLSATKSYLATRVQFGLRLEEFQTLRHRLVDMHIAREELWSLSLASSSADTWGDRNERIRAISAAKIHLNQSGVWAAEQAVQLHGAIGVTEACKVAQCLRRITIASRLFGDVDHHLDRLRVALPCVAGAEPESTDAPSGMGTLRSSK